MKSLFGEVLADDAVAAGAEPHAERRFFVATWYVPAQEWKIWWKEIYITRGEATQRAEELCREVRGHTHYTVLEVRLPGIRGGGESAATGKAVIPAEGTPLQDFVENIRSTKPFHPCIVHKLQCPHCKGSGRERSPIVGYNGTTYCAECLGEGFLIVQERFKGGTC